MNLSAVLSDVPVPSMAVGTMYFGTTVPAEDARVVLDVAYERGARFWDTANNYAFWVEGGTGDESEQCLGGWLAARGSNVREELVLATKVGARPRPRSKSLASTLGLSAAAVREQLTESLRRMGTDYVDVLYAHMDDRAVPLEETVGALTDLQQQGLVRVIAASNLTADRLREAIDAGRGMDPGYRALQQRFTYLVPDPLVDVSPHVLLDPQVEQVCTNAGIAMLGYSPLLSGAYTREDRALPEGYISGSTGPALRELHTVAAEAGLDAGQTVLAWMAQRDQPVLPVLGVSNPEQMLSAVEAVTTELPADAPDRLDAARSAR